MSNKVRLAALLACCSFLSVGAAAGIAGCGGDDSGQAPPDASDQSSPDVGTDAPSDRTVPDAPSDARDGGADANAGDAGDAGDAADACGALSVTGVTPTQGWAGTDVTLTISGTGFVVCGSIAADGGLADAGACVDHFKLVAAACAPTDAGADASDAGDAASSDAAPPFCGDGGSVSWDLVTSSVSDPTTAIATVPTGGPVGGPYTLVDTQNGCTYALPNAYTILPATVTISNITPPYGWTGEDTPITITGANFISTPHGFINVPVMTPPAQKLRSTAFISTTSLTSVVPKGLTAGGPYDVTLINPDNTGGILTAAFRVVSLPPPTISNVSPASLATSSLGVTDNVTITGCNFRNTLTVETVDSANAKVTQTPGTLTCTGAATCPSGTNVCTLTATIGAGLATGAYLVRVTDTDQSTAGDYSALVVTNPSAKLNTGYVTSASTLNVGRRALATTSGRINDASRFLYAIGGEDASGAALNSVEVAPLDLFGTLGTWYTQRYTLNAPRSGATVAQQGGFVYVIGGTSSAGGTGGAAPTGTPLASIERAKILDFNDLPTVADPTTSTTGNLAAGTWYYRVAVLRDANDTDNPNGEGLPSDEVVATLGKKGSANLSWTAPTNATNIAKYRVYRSPAVNGASHAEQLLGETANGSTTTFTDDGSATVSATKPLDRGSSGVFVTLAGTLNSARLDASTTIAPDPSGQLYVYVTGGWGKCPAAAADAVMNCYEVAPLSADGVTLGAFTNGTQLFGTPRARHGAATMTAANGITPWVGNAAFVFLSGGAAAAAPATHVEYAVVNAGGQLGAFSATNTVYATKRDGSALQIANGYLYSFLGGSVGGYTSSTDLSNATAQSATTVTLSSWSNAVSATPASIGRMGVTLESAYFYVIGGTTNDTDALNTIYQVIY